MHTGAPRPYRPPAGERPIRRTWWLLSGAFFLLALITGARAFTSGDPRDWIPFAAVGLAALAAILHRNAVAGLEARGRAEAENFARILQGLSRSVSVDAIVGAIVDDLAEGTGADHVVIVRKRPDGPALEATLVTRRPGVPSSTTLLPLSDLESPPDRAPAEPVAVTVEVDTEAAVGAAVGAATASVSSGEASPGKASAAGAPAAAPAAAPTPAAGQSPARERSPMAFRAASGRPAVAAAVRAADRGAAWLGGFLADLGIASPFRGPDPLLSPRAEVLGGGSAAAVTSRIADRVRTVYGLSHTLAAPLRTDDGLIGAIVLSRRDREPWPEAARRVLEGAAIEAAAAMARAYSHREVAAHASTDPLTGLPNRRYFDEFCGLLARRRRAGDAVAVLMIDIDKFKVLNDTYGHPVGDEVLRAVAGAIVTAVREADVPARVGGEEFAVLLRNPGPDVAVEVGERVRQAVGALDLRRLGISGVSVSVGVANARGADEPIPAIVGRADQALLRAKRAGRDRVIAA